MSYKKGLRQFLVCTCVFVLILMIISCSNIENNTEYLLNEGDIETAGQFVKTALADQKGYNLLKELTDIGHRLSGSETSLQAIDWAYNKMLELGFENVTKQPLLAPNWVRGDIEKAEIVTAGSHRGKELRIAALGGSVGTPAGGITAGVVEVSSFDELRNMGERARGKIIFFNRPLDMSLLNTFSGYGGAVDQRTQGAQQAAAVGGVAALVRSVTTKYDNVPHTGTMGGYPDGIERVPAAAIGQIDADLLSNALNDEPDLQINLDLSAKNLPYKESFNVYGDIIGSEKPDEIIVIGGHFDCWDKGTGAHDDGGGCIQAMEVLDLFIRLGIKPKRTLRAVFFMDEEIAQTGANKYAEYALASTEKHVAAIESDRGVLTPRGFTADTDNALIEKMQGWLPALQQARIEWIRPGGSGVDVGRISNVTAKFGYFTDDQRYFDYHHSANDVFSEVNPREMELGSAAMAILVYLISENGF
ncbi:MAG: M20/M25/M40 family metallo-hydrolase [bacterium]|nr:M20/M25/M40 family metallo-hydrolase [bacterium]